MIRTLLVDDHEIVLRGLQRVLELDGRIQVVGTASNLAEAKSMIERVGPEVIVLDLRLPDARGTSGVKEVREVAPKAKIIVLTGYGAGVEEEAMAAGADMFLTKDLASNDIASVITGMFGLKKPTVERLSPREQDVVRYVAEGLTNAEIADVLSVAESTVKTHVANLLAKLGLRNRVELARYWKER